jgi:hypothetical protein
VSFDFRKSQVSGRNLVHDVAKIVGHVTYPILANALITSFIVEKANSTNLESDTRCEYGAF